MGAAFRVAVGPCRSRVGSAAAIVFGFCRERRRAAPALSSVKKAWRPRPRRPLRLLPEEGEEG